MSMFRAQIIGRLGRDPETRATSGGKMVCNFSVAVDQGFGDRKTTEWVSVSAWGKTGELCQRFLAKGKQVYVDGRLESREYQKDGVTKKVYDLIADHVVFLGSKGEQNAPAPEKREEPPANDDDVPF